ncbi:hypothetical protein Tco_0980307 [Tanacetum coccineum]
MVACCLGLDEFLSWLLVVGKREVVVGELWEHIPIEEWMMIKNTCCGERMTDDHWIGKGADEIDKETVSFGEMQLEQEDSSCVHASNKLHLHVVHIVPSKHESDQHW